jgi:chitodextrinase
LLALTPLVAVLAWTTAAPVAQAEACVVSQIMVNPCRPWLGGNGGNYTTVTPNTPMAQTLAHEARIGRQVDVVHLYDGAGTRPLSETARYFATRPNTILSLTWKPSNKWIDAGGSNATVNAAIDAAAADIKSLGSTKILLSIQHEPENDVSGVVPGCGTTVYKGTGGTVAEYRAMWQNVRQRFDAAGVTNVVWVINYMGFVQWDCMIDDLWPGNDLVDWLVWDPYSENIPFSQTIARFYNQLVATSDADHDYLSKPWGLAEWAAWHQATQPFTYQYYDDAKASIARNEFPRLKLYSIFDNGPESVKTSRIGYTSKNIFDQAEIDRYKTLANSPFFIGDWTTAAPPPPPDVEAPSVPTSLTAVANNARRVSLQWSPSSDDTDVDRYVVTRDGEVLDDDVAATSYSDVTVEPGRSYVYAVSAVDAADNASVASDEVTVETPALVDVEPPTAPAALTATDVAAEQVSVQWEASTDDTAVHHYEVFRGGTKIADDITATGHIDTTVQPGSTYSYRVRAVDGEDNVGGFSETVEVTTPVLPDTAAPSIPSALSSTKTTTTVNLQWQAATDDVGVDHYQVSRDGTVVDDDVTGTTFADAGLQPSTSYSYAVRAVDAARNAGSPAAITVVTADPPDTTAPTTPTGLVTTENLYNRVSLTWAAATDNVGVTRYQVLRGTTVIAASVTTLAFTDAAVAANTTYSYSVRAMDAAGNTGAAAVLSVRTPAVPDTTAPTAPRTLSTSANTATSVGLQWLAATDNIGVAKYQVYRNNVLLADNVTVLRYTDATVAANTSYTYRVRALDAAGNASPSTPDLAVRTPLAPDTTPPTAPRTLTGTAGTRSAALRWVASTDNVRVAGYYVYRGTTRIATVTGLTYTATGLTSRTTYSFTVRAFDAAGNVSVASNAVSVRAN